MERKPISNTTPVHGPFFSWFDEDKSKTGDSIIMAVKRVIGFAKANGPYDGVYGFSTGGVVAALASGISTDASLQMKLMESLGKAPVSGRFAMAVAGSSRRILANMGKSSKGADWKSGRGGDWNSGRSGKALRRASSQFDVNPNDHTFGAIDDNDFSKKPFEFAILACAGFSIKDMSALRELADISLPEDPLVEEGNLNLNETNSFHLIGLEDDLKTKSEEVASLFKDPQVMYLPGGHSVGRDASSDDDLISALQKFSRAYGKPPDDDTDVSFKRMSNVSSIALNPHKQVLEVMLDIERLPEGLHANQGGATILAAFEAQPKEKPFLYNARSPNGASSTYGDIVSFIDGGDGDLRQLGRVKPGEVVAYGAPPGGSAAAALAFLSIGAQTAAAPLAPGMTEPDVLDALDQFDAKHLILFEGVDCPGVEAAFLKYKSATLHRARIIGDDRPGMFEYIDPKFTLAEVSQQVQPLRNPANGTCLLLRTSGTTARPKGVPLVQGALVNNGAILANSMGLQETDVCYSVMPLFHIGGISASILCTLTSGGSVCCDGQPFDPGRMVDALALSKPQPTWYSSVPTIHNATVTFLKDQASQDPKFKAYGIDSSGKWAEGHSLRMIRSGAAALLGPDGAALAAAYGGVPIFPTYSMSEQVS